MFTKALQRPNSSKKWMWHSLLSRDRVPFARPWMAGAISNPDSRLHADKKKKKEKDTLDKPTLTTGKECWQELQISHSAHEHTVHLWIHTTLNHVQGLVIERPHADNYFVNAAFKTTWVRPICQRGGSNFPLLRHKNTWLIPSLPFVNVDCSKYLQIYKCQNVCYSEAGR